MLLALIGPHRLTITNKKGQRRLDDPGDYVQVEIETAPLRKIRVIPILVDEARMPGADELPPTLAPLVRRNAVEISPLTFDTKRLISAVQKTLEALKVSDTATGSAAPTSIARPDRSNQQVAGPEVERLYDQALAAFWTEQWDKAVDLMGQVLSRQPDYADAARKLDLAGRQQQLASHYAQASAAADAGNWEQAVAECTMITDSDPNYRDTSARLAEARHQQQLAGLLAEAHRLHRAGQWAAVINVVEQLQAIDPDAANPDGLIASARAELAAEQRAAKLAADYHTALHLFDAGRWKEAVVALERVTRLDSTYEDRSALLKRARQELAQAAEHTEEHVRRQAAEQADRPAKDPARREEDGQPQSARKPGAGQPPPVDVTGPPVGNARTSVDNVHQVAERALGPQGGPEIEVLAEILGDNETLLNLAWGKEFGLKRGLIVLTDRRLLMVAGRRTAGEWPLSAITTKAWRPRHLWLEGIKFKTSARSAIFIDEVEPKARAGEIIDQINSITGNRYLPGRLDRS